MPRKNAKQNEKRVSLDDLLGGPKGKPNADLYKDDPEKRKHHLRHRARRDQLITPAGGGYKRRLSGDPAKDVLYYELAREFINNGFKKTNAYAAVFGVPIKTANKSANRLFDSVWMRSLVLDMLQGTSGEEEDREIPKEYALRKWMHQIEANVLDYMDDDGKWLSVKELKALPRFAQELIKKLDVRTWEEHVVDGEGQPITGPDGNPITVRHQRVHIEIVDKQKALEHMAKAMRWIAPDSKGGTNIYIGADLMIEAQKRVQRLRRDDEQAIEGSSKRVATD